MGNKPDHVNLHTPSAHSLWVLGLSPSPREKSLSSISLHSAEEGLMLFLGEKLKRTKRHNTIKRFEKHLFYLSDNVKFVLLKGLTFW